MNKALFTFLQKPSYNVFFQPSASSVTNTVVMLSAPNATNEVHSITVTCTIHPDSTADQCVVMAMDDDGRVTSTGNHIDVEYNYFYITKASSCIHTV